MRMEAVAKDGRKAVVRYAHEDLEVCVGIATAAFAMATLRGDVSFILAPVIWGGQFLHGWFVKIQLVEFVLLLCLALHHAHIRRISSWVLRWYKSVVIFPTLIRTRVQNKQIVKALVMCLPLHLSRT